MTESPLEIFHPLIARWFSESLGTPTDIQAKAWPEIAAGRHVLIAAPTGSGKTLAAFLWGIDRLVTGAWPCGLVRLLYVSPLKALNNDVRRNLIHPLSELSAFFRQYGEPFPEIRVLTRSGDTPQSERRRMITHPPEILITTPESLNILLGSKNGRRIFQGVAAVLLDEIHAVAASKRGVHLITAVDRLVLQCGEFQRIALSATVRPEERVAEFIGGYRMEGDPHEPVYRRRAVTVVRSEAQKAFSIEVRFPEGAREELVDDSWWPVLAKQFKQIIRNNRSTLLFANSRRLTEKVARLINEDSWEDDSGEDTSGENASGENGPGMLAYSHHGSLSRELRLTVERKLKKGELKAIVATNSLELGIDIGNLDQVVLIQTPPSVASAVQRIGRSGHRVADVSRGILFPTHGRDFLNAAVAARCVMAQDIEALIPIESPLDVLSQVVLSMCAVEAWNPDRLYAFLKTSAPYHRLSRRQFELVLEMLAGRYADTRLRELRPRLSIDKVENSVVAKPGAAMLLHLSGGTIPDRGYFDLRLADTGAKIGELDEEFVWERSVGDTFAMGNQTWQIRKITHSRVDAVPAGSRPGILPFWRAEARNRDFHLSCKLLEFLEYADSALGPAPNSASDRREEEFQKELRQSCFMDEASAQELIDFLKRQKAATGTRLPHRHHLLIEHFEDPMNRGDKKQVILHTGWGGRINRPYAMALSQTWENAYGYILETFADDDAILLILPHRFEIRDVLESVHSENIEVLLRKKLEKTGFFGARFRENAARALLLPRADFKKRTPLWLNRLRARKLMESVMGSPDFPILLETWRTCMRDEFDLENLKHLLDELTEGGIAVGESYTASASPFAQGLIWQQTNKHMYEDDTPESGKTSGLTEELLREVSGSSALRPRIPEVLIQILGQKLQRTAPGYSPSSPDELLDWVKERLGIPESEWNALVSGAERDHGLSQPELLGSASHKLIRLRLPGAALDSICAVETLPRICGAFGLAPEVMEIRGITDEENGPDGYLPAIEKIFDLKRANRSGDEAPPEAAPEGPEDFLSQWLSFYGPLPASFLPEVFGFSDARLSEVLESLKDRQQIIVDRIREGAKHPEVCDRENFEILLRMARKARRPSFQALEPDALPLFLAAFQGLTSNGESLEDLEIRLEQLFGVCLPAAAWEEFVFPARLPVYQPFWMDSLMQKSELRWFGCGERKIGFAFEEDFELFLPPSESNPETGSTVEPGGTDALALIPEQGGRYGILEIARRLETNPEKALQELWSLAWVGKIGNDTFEAVRSGILNRFSPEPAAAVESIRRGRFNRWKPARPAAGSWYALDVRSRGSDEVQEAELRKDRIRQLFRRYGVLFKEILSRELPALQWGSLFKTLRLMELSGEILSGHFFEGIPGLQFASHEAFRFLQRPLAEEAVYWINAADPASLCGVNVEGLTQNLPPRIASTYLVFHGRKRVLTARQTGKILDIRVEPDHPLLPEYYAFFKVLLSRGFNPRHFVMIETVNGEPAVKSPYAESLRRFGFSGAYKGLELRRRL
ncbi:MAG: DEAD/DEAH box helicase [Desulfobacteraceae bacterium]|nr:MAG: DEAD/DEAH box helicase [Desulfobacteraceae bacterium]